MSESTHNVENETHSTGPDESEPDEDLELDGDEDDDEDDDAIEDADEVATSKPNGRRPRRGRRPEVIPSDPQSLKAHGFLSEVVAQMEMDCQVQLRGNKEEDDRDIRLEITGEDAGRIIGKKGQVLSALQFLANRVLNRPGEERRYVNVDAEGYRSRRDNSLAAMAKRLGKQAMTDGKIITFEPMPPRDRRVVHLALAKLEGVVTRSEGDGETRRVQIIPVRR